MTFSPEAGQTISVRPCSFSVEDDLFTAGAPPGANHMEIYNPAYLISGGSPGHKPGNKPSAAPWLRERIPSPPAKSAVADEGPDGSTNRRSKPFPNPERNQPPFEMAS